MMPSKKALAWFTSTSCWCHRSPSQRTSCWGKSRPLRVRGLLENWQSWTGAPSRGGSAVEVVRAGGRRELVAVKLGLFDTTAGRVEVEGDLHEGDQVVVPSS